MNQTVTIDPKINEIDYFKSIMPDVWGSTTASHVEDRMPTATRVYILILNWNNWRDTVRCLESVFANSFPDYRVVVLDNASTNGSEEKILAWFAKKSIPFTRYDRETAERGGLSEIEKTFTHPSAVFIQTGENRGYGGGNNIGIRYALAKDDCRYVWILNNDTVIDRDALSEMVQLAEADETTGMVGSKLLYYDRPNVLQTAGGCRIVPWMGNASIIAPDEDDEGQWDRPFEPDYITGASLLVKREVIEAIGPMDEQYFLYWEDADWGAQARRRGYRTLYCPKSRVWHKEGGSTSPASLLADYYWVRNGLYFAKRFYPYFLPLIPFSYFAKYTLVRAIKKQPLNLRALAKGMADFVRGRMGVLPMAELSHAAEETSGERRTEKRILLSLPIMVMGETALGKSFTEETVIENVSSDGAYFPLKTAVFRGDSLTVRLKPDRSARPERSIKASIVRLVEGQDSIGVGVSFG